jgi:tRNA-binding protein
MDDFTPAPTKATVPCSVLEALDIRGGAPIERVEEVPRSRKLMRRTVDFGDHARAALAGVRKERENPQEIVGKQALFVVNLEPRTIAGEVSQGMLFHLGCPDDITPVLAMPERTVPNGTRAGELLANLRLYRTKKIGQQSVSGRFQPGIVLEDRQPKHIHIEPDR